MQTQNPLEKKRDTDEGAIADANVIIWSSVHGNHAPLDTTGVKNITELANYLVQSQQIPVNVNSIDIYCNRTITTRLGVDKTISTSTMSLEIGKMLVIT